MSAEQRLRDLLEADAATLGPPQVEHELVAVRTRARASRRRRVALRSAAVASAAAAVVAVVQLSGWGPGSTDGPVASAPGPLVGEYVVDVPATAESDDLGIAGRWVVRIEDDGQILLTPPSARAGAVSGSTLRLEDDRIETNALNNVAGCQSGSGIGTYAWTSVPGGVSFEVVDGDCRGRELLFTATEWRRLP